ncbi:MAG: PD40 domain-containing protein [Sedimentisphaerales bacterium]|nr:PD40 domain-containing protein [Sedimentisphaerales bacterium]
MRGRSFVLLGVLTVCALVPVVSAGWTEPERVTEVNLENAEEWSPFLSFDGRTLYFTRVRSPQSYYGRIYQATRAAPDGLFTAVEQVPGPLNTLSGHVVCEWVSPDDLRMYYHSEVEGTFSLMVSERQSVDDAWPWGRGIDELNSLGRRLQMPRLTADECVVVFAASDIVGGRGDYDLWMADRPDRLSPFGNVTNLTSLDTASGETGPYLSPDGLHLYFSANPTGLYQLFVAERRSRREPFGEPVHLPCFDTPGGNSFHPCLASDGSVFYFVSMGQDRATADIMVSYYAPDYFVDVVNGMDENDGLSPRAALATIQRAIDLARDGDLINVFPGIYREELSFLGKAITVQSIGDAAVIEAPGGLGVSFYMGEGHDAVLRNIVVANSYIGVLCARSSPTIANVTVTGNVYGAEAYGGSQPRIGNSIFWGNAESDLYGCQATYSCVERGSEGLGNFSRDPLFVDAENGDYHVRSVRGRYWPEHDVWVLDDVTSPCIDAGDPAADFSAERKPNGGRLNVGAHGGTAYAEMSEAPFFGDVNGDGIFDANDYCLFTELWEEHVDPKPPTTTTRKR